MSEVSESVVAGRFMLRLNELLRLFDVTDEEYVRNVLPHIPVAQIWNKERAEREIRAYLDRGRK
jgi:hypothetical protein